MREYLSRDKKMPRADPQVAITRPVGHFGESVRQLADGPGFRKARSLRPTEERVALTDPALRLLTDFVWEHPLTVSRESTIDDALRQMIRTGVRALLVVQSEVVTGLITSSDIQGERPLQFLMASGFRRHDEIEVGHIMTRWDEVAKFDWQTLGSARVSDLVAFFKSTAATHLIVVERVDKGRPLVRGLISRSRLERQLGLQG
jgi:CBS domain-containing protein